jgi:hypothetical protein
MITDVNQGLCAVAQIPGQRAEARGFEPRMAAKPNRISSPFTAEKATVSPPRLTQSTQVRVVAICKAAEPVTACRKTCWPSNGPSSAPLRTGPPHARERIRQPLVTHPALPEGQPR